MTTIIIICEIRTLGVQLSVLSWNLHFSSDLPTAKTYHWIGIFSLGFHSGTESWPRGTGNLWCCYFARVTFVFSKVLCFELWVSACIFTNGSKKSADYDHYWKNIIWQKKKKIRSPPNKEKDIFKILKLLQFLKYKNKKNIHNYMNLCSFLALVLFYSHKVLMNSIGFAWSCFAGKKWSEYVCLLVAFIGMYAVSSILPAGIHPLTYISYVSTL